MESSDVVDVSLVEVAESAGPAGSLESVAVAGVESTPDDAAVVTGAVTGVVAGVAVVDTITVSAAVDCAAGKVPDSDGNGATELPPSLHPAATTAVIATTATIATASLNIAARPATPSPRSGFPTSAVFTSYGGQRRSPTGTNRQETFPILTRGVRATTHRQLRSGQSWCSIVACEQTSRIGTSPRSDSSQRWHRGGRLLALR